eukprot:5771133-Pyramimonas_sp.AAC.1
MSTMLAAMDRPPIKPRCSSVTSGPTRGSSNDLTALARMRLSAFVTLRGLTLSNSQMPPPVSVEPENFLGKNIRLLLKSSQCSSNWSRASSEHITLKASNKTSTAKFLHFRQAMNGMPSGPGEVLLVLSIARLMWPFRSSGKFRRRSARLPWRR